MIYLDISSQIFNMRGKTPLIFHRREVAQVSLSWERKASKHWRKYLPAKTAELESQGIFESEIKSSVEKAAEVLAILVGKGAQIEAAKEIVIQEYILLPPETTE
jgi:hypothetical protein